MHTTTRHAYLKISSRSISSSSLSMYAMVLTMRGMTTLSNALTRLQPSIT